MKPVLSIGIIFKNEIRCLERCVESLQPLREALPCELVMADTGADDGSREIAAAYADILFDFPWIDDFAAARNAVMDRCSGEWYFSIDADEWMDRDISQLVRFFSEPKRWEKDLCGVMIRNYYTPELDEESNDFLAVRIVRLSSGIRYVGAIHELLNAPPSICGLTQTLLHHDGYVNSVIEQGNKLERNMKPLREQLARNPEDLKALLQCIESSRGGNAYDSYIRQAVAVLRKEPENWQHYGPPILRYAVLWAAQQNLPELEDWLDWMARAFPNSPYTNIDGAYVSFVNFAEAQDYDNAIAKGELYLRTMADFKAGKVDYRALIFGPFVMSSRSSEDGARAVLADAYFHRHQPEKAREMLLSIDPAAMRPETVENYIKTMLNLHAQSGTDLSPALADFWEKNGPEKKRGTECRQAMMAAAAIAFTPEYRTAEEEQGFRCAYTLFLPLAGKCETGNAAKILAAQTPEELEAALSAVEDWTALPIPALLHAIENGAAFPPPERPLNLETMDDLAARLAADPSWLAAALDRTGTDTPQDLAWADRLALAAVQAGKWEDEARDMALARTFAELESKFLPLCYAPEAPFFLLPPLHRFGQCCARAFAALDGGDLTGYVRHLRQGLETCPSMKPMAEFLLDHTPGLRAPPQDPELLVLAEKVRILLSTCDPRDPAVEAIKASPAYQRVAHLIEEDGV